MSWLLKEIAYTKNGQKEEVEVKNIKSQIRKWNEDYAVRGSMYSSNTSSDFQFGRSLQTWKLLCNEMEEEEWKMLSLERWIFERDILSSIKRLCSWKNYETLWILTWQNDGKRMRRQKILTLKKIKLCKRNTSSIWKLCTINWNVELKRNAKINRWKKME